MRIDLDDLIEVLREECVFPLQQLAGELEDDDVNPSDVRAAVSSVRDQLEEWLTAFETNLRQFVEA